MSATRNHATRLLAELSRSYDDVTRELGAVVRTALYYDPDVTAEQIRVIVAEDRARGAQEYEPSINCTCPFYQFGGRRSHYGRRGSRWHRMTCPARVRVPGASGASPEPQSEPPPLDDGAVVVAAAKMLLARTPAEASAATAELRHLLTGVVLLDGRVVEAEG